MSKQEKDRLKRIIAATEHLKEINSRNKPNEPFQGQKPVDIPKPETERKSNLPNMLGDNFDPFYQDEYRIVFWLNSYSADHSYQKVFLCEYWEDRIIISPPLHVKYGWKSEKKRDYVTKSYLPVGAPWRLETDKHLDRTKVSGFRITTGSYKLEQEYKQHFYVVVDYSNQVVIINHIDERQNSSWWKSSHPYFFSVWGQPGTEIENLHSKMMTALSMPLKKRPDNMDFG